VNIGPESVPFLIRAAEYHDAAGRIGNALECLASINGSHLDPADIPWLGKWLDDKYRKFDAPLRCVRLTALHKIKQAGPKAKSLAPQVRELTTDPKKGVAPTAREALAAIGDQPDGQ
jgi:hypothetical protein